MRVIGLECEDQTEIEVISDRAEEVGCSGLFVALKGARADGNDFANQVRERGGYVLSDQPGPRTIVHPDPRRVYPLLLQAFYDYPSLKLTMIGVTGTNGKSTVTTLLYQMLQGMGRRCCLIGTGRVLFDREVYESPNTTPEPLTLVRLLERAAAEHFDAVIMEVSSQALAMHRVDGLMFDLAVLTNLRQDHLDYHKTLEAYEEAKFQLFEKIKERGTAILNEDDPVTLRWQRRIHRPIFTYGRQSCNFQIDAIETQHAGCRFTLNSHQIETPLEGEFNIWNLAAVLACGFALDLDWDSMIHFCSAAQLPKGRMEIISRDPVMTVVDYAHTASAMQAMLSHWRRQAERRGGKLWTVFGCGGEREKQKRPLMGQIACRYSDFVILCDDNPRREDPDQILAEIADGCDGRQKIIPERGDAIKFAMDGADRNDIIVVAGKGEETFLIQDSTQTCLSDSELIRRCLSQEGG